MKSILTILFAAITFAATANDTTKLRIKPIIANIEGDSIVAIDFDYWRSSDTNSTMTLLVKYYDQSGKIIMQENMTVPARIANKFTRSRSIIDEFILTRKTRIRKP